jgi:uncharacterized protein YabE (DUF348 family)
MTHNSTVGVAIPFKTSEVRTPSLPRGQRKIRTAGQAGELSIYYVITTVDGQEVSRQTTGSRVTRKPVTEVVLVGTQAPPPPAAKHTTTKRTAPAKHTDPDIDKVKDILRHY